MWDKLSSTQTSLGWIASSQNQASPARYAGSSVLTWDLGGLLLSLQLTDHICETTSHFMFIFLSEASPGDSTLECDISLNTFTLHMCSLWSSRMKELIASVDAERRQKCGAPMIQWQQVYSFWRETEWLDPMRLSVGDLRNELLVEAGSLDLQWLRVWVE